MAFTDVLMSETDATIAIVDRHHRPGGHWNDSYPFVRLHQPSSFYGVNSRQLGSGTKDLVGWNEGLYELASGAEVCAYFDQVMQQDFLPTGRVQYFPMCDFTGDGTYRSLVSGAEGRVNATKTVDATYMNVTVPSVTPPSYDVADNVRLVPLNELPRVASAHERYVVIGGGKTAMDACLFLLANGVDPDVISWIMPRDSWLLDRANIQPGPEFFDATVGGTAQQLDDILESDTIDEMFLNLEASGRLMRLDPEVRPTMYRCATVTRAELDQLRRIEDVVRLGRVSEITASEIVLDDGRLATSPDTLHIDCSADGLARRPPKPVFDGNHLTLQTVRTCQQVFSAAFIAHVEAAYDDEAHKNELCTVIPHPDTDIDWIRTTRDHSLNQALWAQDPALAEWLESSRLDGFGTRGRLGSGPPPENLEDLVTRIFANSGPAIEKLSAYLGSAAG